MKFYFFPMMFWLLATFGWGFFYRTEINQAPTVTDRLQSEIEALQEDNKQQLETIEQSKKDLEMRKKEHASALLSLSDQLLSLQKNEWVLKDKLFELWEENERYQEVTMSLEDVKKQIMDLEEERQQIQMRDDNLKVIQEELALKEVTLWVRENQAIEKEVKIKAEALKNAEEPVVDEKTQEHESWWDEFFSFIKEHNTDYGNEYNFKYSGTVSKWAKKIEVHVTHDFYGDLDHYVLQKFVAWDLEREYFTSPRFGTVMPWKNTYTFTVTRSAVGDESEIVREYTSVIDATWSNLISMKTEWEEDRYSWVVKLDGKLSKEIIKHCTWWNDLSLCPEGNIIETDMYYLNVHTVSDPRYRRFDGISSKEKLALGCLDQDVLTTASDVFAPSMVSYLRSKPSWSTTSILLTKKTDRPFENFGTCTIDNVIGRIDMVE